MSHFSKLTVAALVLLSVTPAFAKEVTPAAVLNLQEVPGIGFAIEATVDGKPGRFLFDTGWGASAVTPAMAKVIGCKPWGRVTGFRAIGERLDSQRCNAATFRMGKYEVRSPEVLVVDLMKFLPPGTAPLDGGVGLDLFAGHAVTIQSHAHKVVLETEASRDIRVRSAQEVPVRLVRDSQGAALTVDVAVPTADGDAWMELDTGNNGPTMIAAHMAELVGLKAGVDGTQSLTMPLRANVVVQDRAVVRDLILDGVIGRGFFNRWDLTIDLATGRAWVAKASS